MSELKAIESATAVIEKVYLVYRKSEADAVLAEKDKVISGLKEHVKSLILDNYLKDKELRRQKYKRCLANAHICYKNSFACANYTMPNEKYKHWRRWQTIWSEIANKFKEAK